MSHNITPPLVSIVVRTKDRPKLLQRALRSIAAQTYRPLEAVLVNDGGSDPDLALVREILGSVELSHVSLETNRGRSAAANAGVAAARGAYVGFLDDDDEFCRDHVLSLIGFMQRTGCSVAYSDCETVTRVYDFETVNFEESERKVFRSKDFSMAELLLENYIPLISVLFRRQVFSEIGGFDEELVAYEDWDFFLRCGSREPFCHLPKVTAHYIQWSPEEQIAQSPIHWGLLDGTYRSVILRHLDKFTPETVRALRDAFKMRIDETERLADEVRLRDKEIRDLTAGLKDRDGHIGGLLQRCGELESVLSERERELRFMQAGRGWRLLVRYYRLRDRFRGALGRCGTGNREGA